MRKRKLNPAFLVVILAICLFVAVEKLNSLYSESMIFSKDSALSQAFSDRYQGSAFSLVRVTCKRGLFEPAVLLFRSESNQYMHEVTNDFCLFKLNYGETEGIYQINHVDDGYVVSIKGFNLDDYPDSAVVESLYSTVSKAQKRN